MKALRTALLLGCAAWISVPVVAAAQAPASPDDIVVTAQRREQKLQKVPISAVVVTGAVMQRTGIRNLEELTSQIPDVRIAQAPGTDMLRIRGVGSGANLGFEQSVGTFVDGVYRSRARAARASLFDLDRVEILRGPQTTFFGNSAIGGALNITTRKPGDHLEYDAIGLYGTQGEYGLEAGIGGPIDDRLGVRVAGKLSGMDGYIHNDLLDNKGPRLRDAGGRVSVRWAPTDTVTIDGRVDLARLRDTGTWNAELLNCPADAAFGSPRGVCGRYIAAYGDKVDDRLDDHTTIGPSHYDYNMQEAAIHTRIDLGGASLNLLSGYFHHDYDLLLGFTPTPNGSVVGTVSGANTRAFEDNRAFSQEIRLQSERTQAISWMVGAYYGWDRTRIDSGLGLFYAPLGAAAGLAATDPVAVWVHTRTTRETLSGFGSVTGHATDHLRVNLGLRYSTARTQAERNVFAGVTDEAMNLSTLRLGTAQQQAVLLAATATPAGDFATPHRRDSQWMPSASIEQDITPDAMAYLSYTHGFKAGGYSVQASATTFAPEKVDSFEAGVKSSLFDHRLTLDLAAFLGKYKDLQESTTVLVNGGVIQSIVGNVGSSTSKGIELSGALRVTHALRLSADLAYLVSRYDRYRDGPCTSLGSLTPGCVQDLSGKRTAFAPKWSGNVAIDYSLPLSDRLEARLGGSVFFTSRYFEQANADPLMVQKGFAKLDARLAIGPAGKGWEVAVIGKNLTDRTTASFRQVVPSSPGSVQALTDRPRSVALQLSIRN